MMKVAGPILIVFVIIAFLVNSAIDESSKKVLTVRSLLAENSDLKRIRVGARVSSPNIEIEGGSDKKVTFYVKDPLDVKTNPSNNEPRESEEVPQMKVIFKGLMPDTLKEGRDVIMEGNYIGSIFYVSTLNTQCPSKYEPPKPK